MKGRPFTAVCGAELHPDQWAVHQQQCAPCGTPPFAELEDTP